MPKIYSRYKVPEVSGIVFDDPTLAQQQFKDEVNINTIIARAMQTGDMSAFTPNDRAQFIDASVYDDYQSALDTLQTVEEDFYSLPADLRKEFDNDADKYVEFMSDDANHAKAVELGLLQGSGDEQTPASVTATEQPAVAPPEASTKGPAPSSDA